MTISILFLARESSSYPGLQWRPLRGALTSGLGLGGVSLAWPAVVQLLVFVYSGMWWS